MILEKINEMKEQKIRQYPVNSWRASSLGHPCDRYLVYERTRWQEKKLHNLEMQYIFDMGNEVERIVLDELRSAGFNIYQQQRDFHDTTLGITGHIDGMIELDGQLYPLEIKSCSDYTFKEINSYEDLKRSKKHWLQAYPTQINLYLYFTNKEKGVLLFKNKQSGQYKEIWIDFDWELADRILKRVEALNNHIKNNTLPEKLNTPALCSECPFAHICLPDISTQGQVDIDDNSGLEILLKRWEELKSAKEEFDEVDKQIKEVGKVMKDDITIIGNWILKREIREYETKPQLPKRVKSVIVKISKIGDEQ